MMSVPSGDPPQGWSPPVSGVVVAGHRVASGDNEDPRFPGGTLAMQRPYFAAVGIDLAAFHPGTINLDIAPHRLVPVASRVTLRQVRWHPTEPAEDFSFFDCRIGHDSDALVAGLLYVPHPDTKPEHHQPPTVVEVLAPPIAGVAVGVRLWLVVAAGQARLDGAG